MVRLAKAYRSMYFDSSQLEIVVSNGDIFVLEYIFRKLATSTTSTRGQKHCMVQSHWRKRSRDKSSVQVVQCVPSVITRKRSYNFGNGIFPDDWGTALTAWWTERYCSGMD